jgi:hypothetical protein
MTRKVTVTFEDGTTEVYKGVPDTSTAAMIEAEVKKEFPKKKIKNIHGEKEGVPQSTSTPTPADPKKDIGGTSTPLAKKDDKEGMPQQDFSKDYPDRYTPPGMIRNKRGNLVYY